jgi:hypothetical protein
MFRTLKSISLALTTVAAFAFASYEVLTWGEIVTTSYATLADASSAGVIGRGWLPDVLPTGAVTIAGTYKIDSGDRCWQATVPAASLPEVEIRLISSGFSRWESDVAPLPSFGWFRTCPFDLEAMLNSSELWRRVPPATTGFEYVSIQKESGTFSFWSGRR